MVKLQDRALDSWCRERKLPSRNLPILSTPKPLTEEGITGGDKGSNWVPRAASAKPFKQLSNKELEEKRSKGLYFVSDEKYMIGVPQVHGVTK